MAIRRTPDGSGTVVVDVTTTDGLAEKLGALAVVQLDGSGTVVSGGLTDTQLRASAVPVSMAAAPTGAATAAKQPALGTAGTASADVITVQGIASGTAIVVGGNIAEGVAETGNAISVGIMSTQSPGSYYQGDGKRMKLMGNQGGNLYVAAPETTTVSGMDGLTAANGIGGRLQAGAAAIAPILVANVVSNGTTLNAQRGDTRGAYVVPGGLAFANITTATTTTVKSGAGVLHTLTVNNLGTVASTTTVYDNTAGSGTKIATINTLAGQTSYIYDVAFSTGLTIVTTGTVAPDITVSYR